MYFMVRIPEALKQGDLICIVSPAGKIDGLLIDEAAQFLSQEGFHVEIAPHAKSTYHKFSGTDAQRLDDLQSAINNPKVKAILCARGGYGSMRILDKIEWKAFDKSSKFLIGFSDITAIHQSLYLKGIASVHGIMAKDIARGEMAVKQNLLDLLKGKTQGISIPTHPYNRKASVVAPLIVPLLPSPLLSIAVVPLVYAVVNGKSNTLPSFSVVSVIDGFGVESYSCLTSVSLNALL